MAHFVIFRIYINNHIAVDHDIFKLTVKKKAKIEININLGTIII